MFTLTLRCPHAEREEGACRKEFTETCTSESLTNCLSDKLLNGRFCQFRHPLYPNTACHMCARCYMSALNQFSQSEKEAQHAQYIYIGYIYVCTLLLTKADSFGKMWIVSLSTLHKYGTQWYLNSLLNVMSGEPHLHYLWNEGDRGREFGGRLRSGLAGSRGFAGRRLGRSPGGVAPLRLVFTAAGTGRGGGCGLGRSQRLVYLRRQVLAHRNSCRL